MQADITLVLEKRQGRLLEQGRLLGFTEATRWSHNNDTIVQCQDIDSTLIQVVSILCTC